MSKTIPEHRDKLGRILSLDDCVAYPVDNSMVIGKIRKINPKMIGITRFGPDWPKQSNKYPAEIILLDGPEVSLYLLQTSKG